MPADMEMERLGIETREPLTFEEELKQIKKATAAVFGKGAAKSPAVATAALVLTGLEGIARAIAEREAGYVQPTRHH
jgi:hypothetical protein